MKRAITALTLALTFSGCATFQSGQQPLTFEQAAHAAIPTGDEHQTVVIVIDKTGAITVAGRTTTLEEIKSIREVVGTSDTPPGALIRVEPGTAHADVRAIMDALTDTGVWRIDFAAIKE